MDKRIQEAAEEPEDRLAKIFNKLIGEIFDEKTMQALWGNNYRFDHDPDPVKLDPDRLNITLSGRDKRIVYLHLG
jgi:hypothetical protein